MPNFKSISFKMAVSQGGGQNLLSPCVCYPKDPLWNRVKLNDLCHLRTEISSVGLSDPTNNCVQTDF